MADEFGEKTERATPRRRADLREQGNVPKSLDFAAVATLAATIIPLLFLASMVRESLLGLIHRMLSGQSTGNILHVNSIFVDMGLAFRTIGLVTLPFALLSFAAIAAALASQVGFQFTAKPLQPSLNKLSPIEGFKKFFDLKSLMRFVSSFSKVIIVGGVAVIFIMLHYCTMLVLPRMEVAQAAVTAADLVMQLAIWLLVALLLLAIFDMVYQKWQWERDNRMSKQEIKEEMKNLLGDPQVRKHQREFAMQIMNQRTSQVVPQADVIVTNPEHISIALKWDSENMEAPRVLAKGADFLALRIRQIAIQHGIPIVERKPLARAMYPLVSPGQEIPQQFYAAVAEILAYVYRLEGRHVG